MTGTVLAPPAPLTAQVPRTSRRRLPASETLPPASPGCLPNRSRPTRSRRVPGEPLDARDDLPEQRPCQVAFGELQGEVPSMSDQASAGLEEPLLEARQRPVLDGQRQGQPTEQTQGSGCRRGCGLGASQGSGLGTATIAPCLRHDGLRRLEPATRRPLLSGPLRSFRAVPGIGGAVGFAAAPVRIVR